MRVGIALAAVALALVWASAAAGTPVLVVSGPASPAGAERDVTIELRGNELDLTRIAIYAPVGIEAVLDRGSPGRAPAVTVAGPDGPAVASGPLVPVAPGTEACGTAGHDAVWQLELGTATIAVAVNALGPDDPERALGSLRLEFCPAGGLTLRGLRLELRGVLLAPAAAGAFTWRAVLDPGPPGAAVEARSTEFLPVGLTLRARYDSRRGAAVLTGALTAGGSALTDRSVTVRAGARATALARSGAARTDESGRFSAVRTIVRNTVFRVVAKAPARPDPGGCPDPVAPGGCASATLAPFSVRSDTVGVRAPVAPVLRYGSRGAHVRRLQAELVRLRYLPSGAANGIFGDRTWHAVVAFQGWQRLSRTGVVDRRTWAALGRAGVPRPWGGLRRGIQVDVARQVLLLVRDGATARAIHVSSAAPGSWTPRGRYSVIRKEVLSWSVPFSSWMPYASYFTGGYAIHGYASVPPYPASHGCIRVPMAEAPGVYAAASYGSPVWVR